MPILLENVRRKLILRIGVVNGAFNRLVSNRHHRVRIDRFVLQEGLVSHLWQAWGIFCRETVISSAQGCQTASGAMTASPYSGRSESELAFVAKQIANGNRVTIIRSLPSHAEPTWGDISKLAIISAGLNTSNSGNLLAGFGTPITLKDLQTCRNAGAHITRDRFIDIRAAGVRYLSNQFQHPSDMIFWEDPVTRDFLWRSWIDEMEFASSQVIL